MHTARRTHSFTESVIRGMTRLASEHGAINLAQGFPNFAAPDILKEAAAKAIRDEVNQYAITWGAKRLRDALARKYADWYGMTVDPEAEITVTCGATEAMASALLAIVDPGDEVIGVRAVLRELRAGRDPVRREAGGMCRWRRHRSSTSIGSRPRSRRGRARSSCAPRTTRRAGCCRGASSKRLPSCAGGTTRMP